MNKKVFSLPINPKLSEDFVVNTFLPFLKEYKEDISTLPVPMERSVSMSSAGTKSAPLNFP